MTTRTFPKLPGCGRVASARVEFYTRTSLDGAAYACVEHVDQVRAVAITAGFSPYAGVGPVDGKRCGAGVDYTGSLRFIEAPEPPTDNHQHTPFCVRMVTAEGDCAQREWCGAGWIDVTPPGSLEQIEVLLHGSYEPDGSLSTGLTLRVVEFGQVVAHDGRDGQPVQLVTGGPIEETRVEHAVTLDQAAMLAAVLNGYVGQWQGGTR